MSNTAGTPAGGIPAETVAEFLSTVRAALDLPFDPGPDIRASYGQHRGRIHAVRAAAGTLLGTGISETGLAAFAAYLREQTGPGQMCEAARGTYCGGCGAAAGQPCSVPGVHYARLARARRAGLIGHADFASAIHDAGVFDGMAVFPGPEAGQQAGGAR